MNIFEQIEKAKISPEQLVQLTDQELIRLEKQLKAEVRINENVNINDVENLLTALKKNQKELKLLYSYPFWDLRTILSLKKGFFIFEDPFKKAEHEYTVEEEEQLVTFLQLHFEKGLIRYIEHCLKHEHYYALYCLLFYQRFFHFSFVDLIGEKLLQKLVFMNEYISLKGDRSISYLNAAMNPWFYRCLNEIGGIRFESGVNGLLNLTVDKLRKKTPKLKLLLAMGSYKATNTQLSGIIKQNKEAAYDYGVREITYSYYSEAGKGGTYIDSAAGSSARKGSPFQYMGIALVIVIAILKLGRLATKTTNSWEKTEPVEIIELMKEFQNKSYPDTLENNAGLEFYTTIKSIHGEGITIVGEEDIPFELEATALNEYDPYILGNKNVTLKNTSDLQMIFAVEGDKWLQFYTVDPGKEIVTFSSAKHLRIYSGEQPQLIQFHQGNGILEKHFRFKEFTEENSAIFEQYLSFEQEFDVFNTYQIEVNVVNLKVELDIAETAF